MAKIIKFDLPIDGMKVATLDRSPGSFHHRDHRAFPFRVAGKVAAVPRHDSRAGGRRGTDGER